jgi:hypothetical protein
MMCATTKIMATATHLTKLLSTTSEKKKLSKTAKTGKMNSTWKKPNGTSLSLRTTTLAVYSSLTPGIQMALNGLAMKRWICLLSKDSMNQLHLGSFPRLSLAGSTKKK